MRDRKVRMILVLLFLVSQPFLLTFAQAQNSQPLPVVSPAELDSLVAPIALYPDPLLSQVLVAATYPLEIVEAAQWVNQNPGLTGSALQNAASQQNWDPSVQALVMFPDALRLLSENVQWTTALGNAFLAQQTGIMDSVQRMRSQAVDSGKLRSNPQEVVTTQNQAGAPVVEIEPASPQVVYVPVYDPYMVWGTPYYPYPVIRRPRSSFFIQAGVISFAPCVYIGSVFSGWGGWGSWGWHPNWYGRNVVVNNVFINHYGYNRGGRNFEGRGPVNVARSTVWNHDSGHRTNVPYAGSNNYVDSRRSDYRGPASSPQPAVRSMMMPSRIPERSQAPTYNRPSVNSFVRPGRTYTPPPSVSTPAPGNNMSRGPAERAYVPNRESVGPARSAIPNQSYRSSPDYAQPQRQYSPSRGGGESRGDSRGENRSDHRHSEKRSGR